MSLLLLLRRITAGTPPPPPPPVGPVDPLVPDDIEIKPPITALAAFTGGTAFDGTRGRPQPSMVLRARQRRR